MAPEYGTALYWESRFRSDPNAYEWLVSPDCFHDPVLSALKTSATPNPKLLHIGCGSSELSYHLRFLVDEPAQVHNVDFSKEAIELGRKHDDRDTPMHWSTMDLLSGEDVRRFRDNTQSFECIVDKGTAVSYPPLPSRGGSRPVVEVLILVDRTSLWPGTLLTRCLLFHLGRGRM